MPTGNRLARTPGPIRDFEGSGRISSGAAAPAAGGAEAYEALFSASAGFSDKLGKMADKAAAREGEAEGRAAGREAAGRVADDSFAVAPPKPLQLRRDGTIRGEAFDRAAQAAKGWRDTLALDTGIRQAYDENGDDPDALDASLGELRAEFSKGVGDPEQLEQFERVFDSKSLAYRLKAQTDAEQRAEAEMKAQGQGALDEQLAGFGKQMYLVGANPQGEAIMSDLLKQGTASIERAIVDGVISPQQGQRLVADYGNKAITARLAGVFDALPDGKARLGFAQGLMDAWKKDRGAFGKVDQGVVERISSKLQAKARHEISGANNASQAEKARMTQAVKDDLSSVSATGERLEGGPSFDDVAAVLGERAAVEHQSRLGGAQAYFTAVGDMEVLPMSQIVARVEGTRPKPGAPGFDAAQKLHNDVLKFANRTITGRASDPVKAVQAHLPEDLPELTADADALARNITARLASQTALEIAPHVQRAFSGEEASEIARQMNSAPEVAQAWSVALAQLPADQRDLALRQIGDEAPELAAAADISLRSGNAAVLERISQQKAIDREDGGKGRSPLKDDRVVLQERVGDAFAALPRFGNAVQTNAWTLFRNLAAEDGVAADASTPEGRALLDRATQMAAGRRTNGGVDYGGIVEINGSKVIAPAEYPADMVETALDNLREDDLAALPPIKSANSFKITPAQIQSARLVTVGDGLYRVALGNGAGSGPKFLQNEHGDYWVLNIRDLAEAQSRGKADREFRRFQ